VGEAQEKSDDLAAKHEVEWRMMSDAVRAANEAAVTLTKPEYLTPEQRDTLAALEKKCHAASIAIADAQQAIPIIKDLIETADRDLARMAAEWAPQGRINSARRTVDARRERLRTAEETVGTRQREIDDAAKQRDAIYEEIRRAAGG
jgi:chromosome segregation ATPase